MHKKTFKRKWKFEDKLFGRWIYKKKGLPSSFIYEDCSKTCDHNLQEENFELIFGKQYLILHELVIKLKIRTWRHAYDIVPMAGENPDVKSTNIHCQNLKIECFMGYVEVSYRLMEMMMQKNVRWWA